MANLKIHWLGTACIALALGCGMASAHEIIAGDLDIRHPYAIEPTDASKDVSVYMVIRNDGDGDTLVAARSPFATSTTIVGSAVGSIDLPAHAETVVGPATGFVKLRGLTEPLAGYQYFPMTLVFAKAGDVDIEVYVEDAAEIQQAKPETH